VAPSFIASTAINPEDGFQPFEPLFPRRLAGSEIHVQQHNVESVPFHEIGDALGPPAGNHLGETAPQQQAGRRQDVVVVVNNEDGADVAH
jgi:hypothetical protein